METISDTVAKYTNKALTLNDVDTASKLMWLLNAIEGSLIVEEDACFYLVEIVNGWRNYNG